MEQVRSDKPIWSILMDLISPLIMLVIGTNIDRQTEDNALETGILKLTRSKIWIKAMVLESFMQ